MGATPMPLEQTFLDRSSALVDLEQDGFEVGFSNEALGRPRNRLWFCVFLINLLSEYPQMFTSYRWSVQALQHFNEFFV